MNDEIGYNFVFKYYLYIFIINNINIVEGIDKRSDPSETVLQTVIPNEFEGPNELYFLKGLCFKISQDRNEYSVCPFHNITETRISQPNSRPSLLGIWSGWIKGDILPNMMFINGDICLFKHKTTKIRLQCNFEDFQIIDFNEINNCDYAFTLGLPINCDYLYNILEDYPPTLLLPEVSSVIINEEIIKISNIQENENVTSPVIIECNCTNVCSDSIVNETISKPSIDTIILQEKLIALQTQLNELSNLLNNNNNTLIMS